MRKLQGGQFWEKPWGALSLCSPQRWVSFWNTWSYFQELVSLIVKLQTFCCCQINGMKFPSPFWERFSHLFLVREHRGDARFAWDPGLRVHISWTDTSCVNLAVLCATFFPASVKRLMEKSYKNCTIIFQAFCAIHWDWQFAYISSLSS